MTSNKHDAVPVNAASNAIGSTEGWWLILEFPDGVRGGRGRIQGTGPRPPLPGPGTDGSDTNFFDRLLQQIRDCGAAEPYLRREMSHSFVVISRSTSRDREVIGCLVQTTPHHFNAGLGSDQVREFLANPREFLNTNPGETPRADYTRFREFESAPDRGERR